MSSILTSLFSGSSFDATANYVLSGHISIPDNAGNTNIRFMKMGTPAGLDGEINMYPDIASKGYLDIYCNPNAGDYFISIQNASFGQSSTLQLIDPGAATANFVLSEGAATINGVKTFGSIPIGTAQVEAVQLPVMTALAGAAKSIFVAPFSGTITNGRAVVDGAFITSDITVVLRINTTNVTNGSMTLATAGSGFGTKATCTPSAANTFVAGDVINATLTGGVNAASGAIQVYFTRTA